jgi:regulator of PEP synthase PpsR (kinase-PPPase family)
MNADERKRMAELCTAIAGEQDSQRLIGLVDELNRLLALKEERLKQRETEASHSFEPSDNRLAS